MPSRLRPLAVALSLTGLPIAPVDAQPVPTVYGMSGNFLIAIDVEEGSVEEIGSTGGVGIYGTGWAALTDSPSGRLFGLRHEPPHADTVQEIDPASGLAGTEFGDCGAQISFFGFDGLAIDPAGRFWLVATDRLFSIDPATGDCTLETVLAAEVTSLAASAGELFTFRQEAAWSLVRIDLASGALEPVVALPEVDGAVVAADFDGDGALWYFTRRELEGGGDVRYELWRRSSGGSGEPVSVLSGIGSVADDPLALLQALAVRGAAPVSIPAVSSSGLATLGLLLAAVGVGLSIRRRRLYASSRLSAG